MTKVKNLGQVAAIIHSHTEPINKRILWYDTSVEGNSEVMCPIKFYNQITGTWEFLVK